MTLPPAQGGQQFAPSRATTPRRRHPLERTGFHQRILDVSGDGSGSTDAAHRREAQQGVAGEGEAERDIEAAPLVQKIT